MKTPLPSIAVLAAALLAGCGRPTGEAPSAELPAVRVRLAPVRSESVSVPSENMGSVRPARSAQLAAKVMGVIEEMPVALGQRVRAGDLLVVIRADEIGARVAQAESGLSAAKRDFERERDLLAKGASTQDMVKGLEDRYAAAEAMVGEARAMLAYTHLAAPFDGRVAGKQAQAGDLASPGQPLLVIESEDSFTVDVALPDSVAQALSVGMQVAVSIPGRGAGFAGTLTEISSAADPGSHTVLAKVAVPAGAEVHSGEFARVSVPGATQRALTVPAGAVAALGQMERVFVYGEGGRAVMRLVRTGAQSPGAVEVLSGLDAGEKVVLDPPPGLREGQPLEVLP